MTLEDIIYGRYERTLDVDYFLAVARERQRKVLWHSVWGLIGLRYYMDCFGYSR